jgi:hypothetical protein
LRTSGKYRHGYRCKGLGKIAWALRQSVEALAKADQHHSSARPSRARRCRIHGIAKRPSERDGIRKVLEMIWVGAEAEYFCKGLWTD